MAKKGENYVAIIITPTITKNDKTTFLATLRLSVASFKTLGNHRPNTIANRRTNNG